MKQKYLPTLLMIGIITLFAIGCNKQQTASSTQTNNASAPQIEWQTYTSKNYSYQIAYPKGWTPTESQGGMNVRFIAPPANAADKTSRLFSVEVADNPQGLSPVDYLKSNGLVQNKDFTVQPYTLSGESGVRTTIGIIEHVYVTKGKYIYTVARLTNRLDAGTYDQILPTFKFVK